METPFYKKLKYTQYKVVLKREDVSLKFIHTRH